MCVDLPQTTIVFACVNSYILLLTILELINYLMWFVDICWARFVVLRPPATNRGIDALYQLALLAEEGRVQARSLTRALADQGDGGGNRLFG